MTPSPSAASHTPAGTSGAHTRPPRTAAAALFCAIAGVTVAAVIATAAQPAVASHAAAASPATPIPGGYGAIVGGIAPCEGIVVPGGPTYAAGTVTVFRGHETWRSTGPGTSVVVFPHSVAARVTVGVNSTYRFVLPPGPYVLSAHYLTGNVESFIGASVVAGVTQNVNIPNECK